MLEKADDPYKALLSYRNSPLDGVNLSPAQILMGRRLRTFIPVTEGLLKPRTAKELLLLKGGEVVRLKEGSK